MTETTIEIESEESEESETAEAVEDLADAMEDAVDDMVQVNLVDRMARMEVHYTQLRESVEALGASIVELSMRVDGLESWLSNVSGRQEVLAEETAEAIAEVAVEADAVTEEVVEEVSEVVSNDNPPTSKEHFWYRKLW